MYDLKTLPELLTIIQQMDQQQDLSLKVKSRKQLESQLAKALNRIRQLEESNLYYRNELDKNPDYRNKKLLQSVISYMEVLR